MQRIGGCAAPLLGWQSCHPSPDVRTLMDELERVREVNARLPFADPIMPAHVWLDRLAELTAYDDDF